MNWRWEIRKRSDNSKPRDAGWYQLRARPLLYPFYRPQYINSTGAGAKPLHPAKWVGPARGRTAYFFCGSLQAAKIAPPPSPLLIKVNAKGPAATTAASARGVS